MPEISNGLLLLYHIDMNGFDIFDKRATHLHNLL